MIETILFLAMAAITLTLGVLSWLEKGCLFNNAYIWATPQERSTMNKKPYYRQSAIAFGLLGVMSLLMAGATFPGFGWLWIAGFAVAIGTVIYAVASSALIERAREEARP